MSRPGKKSYSDDKNNESGGENSTALPGEPVAIIGMGCRFPGASDPEALWQVLAERTDCISEIPRDRFPDLDAFYDPTPGIPGKVVTRQGGFLEQVDGFDPYFFGISPREATFMDPQQRLLLEVGWEAIEDAGLPIESLSRSRTGVYLGLWTSDYEVDMFRATSEIDLYMTTGGSRYAAAGRMSYVFDLQGPSMVADTACSTSLVTAHLACQSLRMGECDLALAGGVNLIIQPPITIAFSKAKMLSPDGRCKFGDAAANGYVRSEGCGVVVLKPLSKALADGDRIYATVLGSAVNSDGQEGLFVAPSQGGQEKMLREAYRFAGRAPSDVTYLEAHGTGTGVGDPTELGALGAVLGDGRPADRPCIVGSVKTNIGHTESAAGAAGLIKAAMCLERRTVPPTLHLNDPNPEIPWDNLRLRLPKDAEAFPDSASPALAGVNSFGISGTNAHVVLEEPPRNQVERRTDIPSRRDAYLLPLSARSDDALAAMASKWLGFLRDASVDGDALHDTCFTAGARRSHHDCRLAVCGANRGELIDALEVAEQVPATPTEQLADQDVAGVETSTGPVFVFSGQGPQWWAMGRGLFESEPVYQAMIRRIDELARPLAGWSIIEELNADESSSRLDETEIAQPTLFALQMGLDSLWRSWGIEPGAIVGHSLGEIAAVCAAGVLSLEDAVRVVVHRGRLLQGATGLGKMAAVELTLKEADEAVSRYEGRVGVAAINSPSSVTLSGETVALEEIVAALEKRGTFCQMLPVNYAFHSPQVATFADTLRDEVAGISSSPANTTLVTTVTGKEAVPGEHGPEYWAENVRHRVEFAAAIDLLIEAGHRTFLEMSPHPALTYSVGQCLAHRGETGTTLASLRRDGDECQSILAALGALYMQGHSIDWNGVYPAGGRCVSLPTYPWQRERFWFDAGEGSGLVDRTASARAFSDDGGSNLGRALRAADQTGHFFWEKLVAADVPHFLRDHRVEDAVTFPAAAYVENALAATHDTFGDGTHELADMTFESALSLGDDDLRVLQTSLRYEAPGTFACRFHSRDSDEGTDDWTLHAQGTVWLDCADETPEERTTPSLNEYVDQPGAERVDHYADMDNRGLNYGPAFRAVDDAWRGDDWVAARLHVPAEADWQLGDFCANPGVWDAGFQLLVSLAPESESSRRDTFLPVAIQRARRSRPFGDVDGLWAVATARSSSDDVLEGDIHFLDAAGETVAAVEGLRLLRLERTREGQVRDWLYDIQWEPVELDTTAFGTSADISVEPLPPINVDAVAQHAADGATNEERLEEGRRAAQIGPELDRLCGEYAQQALATLGWGMEPGQTASGEALAEELGIVDTQKQMFERVLEFLAEDGVLDRDGNGWKALRSLDTVSPALAWKTLAAEYPEFRAELDFLSACGDALAEVFRGRRDPLELLFSEESAAALEHLYQDAPLLRGLNELARGAFADIVSEWPDRETIRVLEIGAGTGGTTKRILEELPHDRTDYVFTDLSPAFLSKASEKFVDYPFLRTAIFDVESNPQAQGFASGSFDVIVASNVLHATRDLDVSLENARRLLAPNGVLILVEGIRPTRWIDMIFGLTEGWWRFGDTDLRPAHPLLSGDAWASALSGADFRESAAVSGVETFGGALFDQAVIVARASEIPAHAREAQSDRHWLIFADRKGTGEGLADALRAEGAECDIVLPAGEFAEQDGNVWHINPDKEGDYERLIESAIPDDKGSSCAIAHLWALDAPGEGEDPAAGDERMQNHICGSALRLSKALAARERGTSPHLWFVTRGAQPVGNPVAGMVPTQASLWGFAKVIGLEHPELAYGLVDLDPADEGSGAAVLASVLTSPTVDQSERWVAIRGGHFHGARLAHVAVDTGGLDERLEVPENRAHQLQITTRGALDNLILAPIGRRVPDADEVEIRIHATGQNFRDVLNVLGMYPGDPGPLGLECSGVVTAVGDRVRELRVGDPVAALARGSFASFATAPAALVAPKPDCLGFEQAAAIPVVYLTAHYALRELAKIKKGDRVLVHAASGGVGMAAVQIALAAGAQVFGTAGSPAKRATLEAMGVHHVMDSRSLDFAESIKAATKGQGVDIVLNSLAGDFITKSFEVLTEDGAFVEIGKAGIWTEEQARAARKNCDYHIFDLTEAMRDTPDEVGAAFRALLDDFSAAVYAPPPVQTFPIEQTVAAFREMSQAKHIGKIVITQGEGAQDADAEALAFRSDGTYLITGGLGGLGRLIAGWAVEHGARHIVLTGRSAPSADAETELDELRDAGVSVSVVRADVGIRDDVTRVLDGIGREGPPLVGVFHCAGVLDDGVLLQQTWDRIWTVLAPKVLGGWYLHELTRSMPLDTFVLFSSWCSVLGSPGQANHSAANAFLDTLAHHRRSERLPALSVNWGPWAEIGAAARADRSENLARRGIGNFTPQQGLDALERLLLQGAAQAAVVPFDIDLWRQVDPLGAKSRLFDRLAAESQTQAAAEEAGAMGVRQAFEAAAPGRPRVEVLEEHVCLQVAQVLRLTVARIDRDKPFKNLGLDSLTGLELRNRLESSLDLSLPATLVWNYPSVTSLAGHLSDRMDVPQAAADSAQEPLEEVTEDTEPLEELLDKLESLSDEDAAHILESGSEGSRVND